MMNEKFFDLKKEKQDRMMNAGLQIFALNGYRHASTDDIIKQADISKGLLFHYFGSKAGYYAFLYSYMNRYALLELSSSLRDPQKDFFQLQRDILRAESVLMDQYPYLFLFMESVRNEDDSEGLSSLGDISRNVYDFYDDVQSKADFSEYTRVDQPQRLESIIHYVKIGVMREILIDPTVNTAEYMRSMESYIRTLQHLAVDI